MEKSFPKVPLLISVTTLFVIQVIWNVYLYTLPSHQLPANFWFNAVYATTFLISGLVLLFFVLRRRVGGEIASALGYLGTGALVFGIGLYIWAYYNLFANQAIPHPSLADAFFLVYPWLLVIGTLRLLRFYTPLMRWPVLLEALMIFFIAAVPIYHYYIVPSLRDNLVFLDKLSIYDTLIANATVLGLVYLLWRIGGGRLRAVLAIYSFSYLALAVGQFIFQYRFDNNLYWNGDPTDSLMVVHGYLFALAAIYTISTVFSPQLITPSAPGQPDSESQ